jgi:uncharacterized repeat protein (TIGR03803 family)
MNFPKLQSYAVAAMAGLFLLIPAQAQTFKVLYTFTGGADGAYPTGTLVRDSSGDLYGTTQGGGNNSCQSGFIFGCGVVFKIDSSGKESTVHTFTGPDGINPVAGLITDPSGNFYGTASGGGTGGGTIFKISSTAALSVLYSFAVDSNVGQFPIAPVIRDSSGNLYGTTSAGGVSECAGGCGTVYKLDTTGKLTNLYVSTGANDDGGIPYAPLFRDPSGNVYGTATSGGNGSGTVFKVSPTSTETVIYSFKNLTDGASPWSGLLADVSTASAIGTTFYGGKGGAGTVYRITASGKVTTLYSFTGGADGGNPAYGTLVADNAGNLYGTTSQGGTQLGCSNNSCGVVFELSPNGSGWTEKVLHTFTGGSDGANPFGGLILDGAGNLYGTAATGGAHGGGTVFEITK